jgi:hypothetical protein
MTSAWASSTSCGTTASGRATARWAGVGWGGGVENAWLRSATPLPPALECAPVCTLLLDAAPLCTPLPPRAWTSPSWSSGTRSSTRTPHRRTSRSAKHVRRGRGRALDYCRGAGRGAAPLCCAPSRALALGASRRSSSCDAPICPCSPPDLAFLHSGSHDDYWRVLWERGNITKEYLENMNIPIKGGGGVCSVGLSCERRARSDPAAPGLERRRGRATARPPPDPAAHPPP